jgi:hypothetical protein
MRNPRLYGLLACMGLLGRASYGNVFEEVNAHPGGWTALVVFWIPLAAAIWIGFSLLRPLVRRWLDRKN